MPKIVIVKKHSIRDDGTVVEGYTCMDGQYRLWPDRTPGSGKWRWALKDWPDDGLGIQSHGSAASIEEAARACAENLRLRESVPA